MPPFATALAESGLENNQLLLAAIGLLVAGLAFKIAAFPFHAWAPDAYQGASAPVAAFLAAASKAAGLAALGRVCLVAFESEARLMSAILMGLAALSMIIGSILAVAQTDMKRLLAYSSIAHAGYALLGLIAATSATAVEFCAVRRSGSDHDLCLPVCLHDAGSLWRRDRVWPSAARAWTATKAWPRNGPPRPCSCSCFSCP